VNDDFDAQLVSALRTLERDPDSDGRGAVARRVRRRRVRGVAGAAAVALVVGIGIGAVVANDDSSPRVTVGQSGPAGPTAPPISAANTGVLTYPTTVAPGDEFAAVLRNPLSGPNTSCFISVRLERWDGDSWGAPRELLPEGVDPNLAGPGADCAPDLIQPGAFVGERTYTVPNDLPSGNYRIVETSTEGEGRLTVIGPNMNYVAPERPASRHSIDLAPGGDLNPVPKVRVALDRVVLLNDDRLAISWHSSCNVPGSRVDFDYTAERVTARVVVGGFTVIDCVGEPDLWSTVIDLPAPLWGRPLDVTIGDDTQQARRVAVTPIRTYVLPETEPGKAERPAVPTSIFQQTPRSGSIQARMYGACISDAQSAVYADADDTFYLQPHVQVIGGGNPDAQCHLYPMQTLDVGPVNVAPGSTVFGPTSP
jgi:hypothetical protein